MQDQEERKYSKHQPKDRWDKAKILSGIVASILIPVTVVAVGNFYTSALKRAELDLGYFELAVGILDQSPSSQDSLIRDWAVGVLAERSPITLDSATRKAMVDQQLVMIDEFLEESWIPIFVRNMLDQDIVLEDWEAVKNGTADEKKQYLAELLEDMIAEIIAKRREMQSDVYRQPSRKGI